MILLKLFTSHKQGRIVKVLKVYMLQTLLFAGYVESMEQRSKEPLERYGARDLNEQLTLNDELYSLLMDDFRHQNAETMFNEGEKLIKKGADIVTTGDTGMYDASGHRKYSPSLISAAAKAWSEDNNVLPLLLFLENGLDVNTRFKSGLPIIFLNLVEGRGLASASLDRLAEETKYEGAENILHWPRGPFHGSAVLKEYEGNQKRLIVRKWVLRWLIEQGARLDCIGHHHRTPLILAAESYLELMSDETREPYSRFVVKTLIENGVRVDGKIEPIEKTIRVIYFNSPTIVDLLLNGETGVLKALADGTVHDIELTELFLVAVGQGAEELVCTILKTAREQISMEAIRTGLAIAAQLGKETMFTTLFQSLQIEDDDAQDAINKALLTAAVQNKGIIVDFLIKPHHNEEPPRKKRRIEQQCLISYDPLTIIEPLVLDYALMRAARQGYIGVVKSLLVLKEAQLLRKSPLYLSDADVYTYTNEVAEEIGRKTIVYEEKDLGNTLMKCLELAMMRRHFEVVSFLLERFGSMINNQQPRGLIRNILRNPILTELQRYDYTELFLIFNSKIMAEQIWHKQIYGSDAKTAIAESSIWRHLPVELVALILSFLYKPYHSEKALFDSLTYSDE